MTYKEKIVNVQTGEETWRDFTPEEIEKIEADKKRIAKELAEATEKASARQALLDRLGITPEESKLLFG